MEIRGRKIPKHFSFCKADTSRLDKANSALISFQTVAFLSVGRKLKAPSGNFAFAEASLICGTVTGADGHYNLFTQILFLSFF